MVREPALPGRSSAPTSQIRARLLNVQNYRADKSLGVRDRERLRPSRTSESRTVKFIYKGKRVFGTKRRHASNWYIQ